MNGPGIPSDEELRRDFVGGMRSMAPWLVGSVPFGLVIGVTAAQADLPTLVGWLTGPLIFGGTAQVATIQMLDAGAAPYVVILTVMVINLRLAIYSAAMATYWRGTPLWWRLLGGYLLVDPSFVVGAERYDRDPDRQPGHAHYLGGAILLWVTWLSVISVGAMVGAQLPQWLRLDFLIVLYLVGEIVPKLRQAAARRAVLVAVRSPCSASVCPCTWVSRSGSCRYRRWVAARPARGRPAHCPLRRVVRECLGRRRRRWPGQLPPADQHGRRS